MPVNLEQKIKRTVNKLAQQLRDIANEEAHLKSRRKVLIQAISVNRKVLKNIYEARQAQIAKAVLSA